MNPTETTQENQFVLRRLGESFPQFASDLWRSVPLWLLVLAVLAVAARTAYLFGTRGTRAPGRGDPLTYWSGWGVFGLVGALLVTVLVEFYRRDTASLKAAGAGGAGSSYGQSNPTLWWLFVGGVFALGAAYAIAMYVRDSRSIRWFWAAKLALLRITVYAILCFVFLLPAQQTWERVERRSRVLVLVDITPSLTRKTDEVGTRVGRAKYRMDTLIEFLTDDNVRLIKSLLEKNPVVVYPFGTRLDDAGQTIAPGEVAWGKEEWQAFAQYDFRPFLLQKVDLAPYFRLLEQNDPAVSDQQKKLEEHKITISEDERRRELANRGPRHQGLSEAGKTALRATTSPDWNGPKAPQGSPHPEPANWAEWAAAWYGRRGDAVLVPGMSPRDTYILRENIVRLDRRIDVARTIAQGTNVPDSVLAAVNRESVNMLQGIIVLSDFRSNLGSEAAIGELRARAAKEKIPVFTIGVGEYRQSSSITITDVQADDVASPDQGFTVSVEADGTNLAGKTVPVYLDLFLPNKDPKADAPDFTMKEDTAKSPPTPYTITFAPGDPPHGQVEFVIDPARLAKDKDPRAVALTEKSKEAATIKDVLKEGKWSVRARIPKDENEAFAEAEHVRVRPDIQVVQRKLRVLLVASGPSREFQFLRTFLTREVLENRAELSLLIQNEAGSSNKLTANPTERVLNRFPTRLDLKNTVVPDDEKPYNLNEYDLIVAFDPDWTEISQEQAEAFRRWVQEQGGGLIYVADRINTFQLARVEPNSRLSPILDVLPVVPQDIVAVRIKSIPKIPRRLYLDPVPGSELLKLYSPPLRKPEDWTAEEKKRAEKFERDPIAGWELFFTDRETYARNPDDKVELFPRRGFYSCYPIKGEGGGEVNPGAKVLATFADVDDAGNVVPRPWLVTNNPSAAWRTCFMASPEMYRIYSYDPDKATGKEFYERYWAKMLKYMAAKRNVKAARGRVLTGKEYISGTPIRVQARILDPNSKPYPLGAGGIEPKFRIVRTLPDGTTKEEGPYEMAAKPSPSGFDGYYQGQVLADPRLFPPGDDTEYAAVVDIPDAPGEPPLRSKFKIVRSDPEMDNTRPDDAARLAIASEFGKDFQGRVSDDVKARLIAALPKDNGVPRLAFKVTDAELLKLIPEFMQADRQQSDNRGPERDLWDLGVTAVPSHLRGENPPPKKAWDKEKRLVNQVEFGEVSWVLLLVVGLLCWEWTTRKLLRLA